MKTKKTTDSGKQEFLDVTAQHLYAHGFPLTNIYGHAERLWQKREEWLRLQEKEGK